MMKKNILIFLFIFSFLAPLVVILSCEKQQAGKFEVGANSPPLINSINILPDKPGHDSDLSLTIQSQDSNADPITYQYQWIGNDQEIFGENTDILKSGNFRKGDFIQVKVIPSDGKEDGKPFLSDPVKIINSPPVIKEMWIEPKVAYANDQLKVLVKSSDSDGDSVYYTYQWEINGTVLDMDKEEEVLNGGNFKKGDRIAVKVIPDDRESQGLPKESEPLVILNSPPIIVSTPPVSIEGSEYSYQIKAHDSDNDPISFKLKNGPKGMEIDQEKGLIQWTIQSKDKGTHSIEIEASDQEGAKSFQRFDLNVEINKPILK
jgi:hypothetical protein